MKITNDILKDYFYDKCSHEEEIEIQKWLTENDNSLVDQSFREIISEIQMENHELSQKAFEKFQKATQPQQVRTPRPGLQRSIRWMQRVAAVLFIAKKKSSLRRMQWKRCRSRSLQSGATGSFPAGSSSGCCLPVRCAPHGKCCFWTSRSPGLIPRPRRRCMRLSKSSTGRTVSP